MMSGKRLSPLLRFLRIDMQTTLAIDFGTTNSVMGLYHRGEIEMIPLGRERLESRSVLFYSFEDRRFYVGDDAVSELEDEVRGRYFVALKSFLGSENEIETTIGGVTYKIEDLIAIILQAYKTRAQKHARQEIDRVVLGRPVYFHDTDPALDALAQERLHAAAQKAGFKEVSFLYEPVAAAYAYSHRSDKTERVLVVDIGGGTTDFSIVSLKKHTKQESVDFDIVAWHGLYVGGDSFDAELIKHFVIEHLGAGSRYINMGKEMQIGNGLYYDLTPWHRFHYMYRKEVREQIQRYIYMSCEKEKIKRLWELIEEGLYFDFSEKIMATKIALSTQTQMRMKMDMFQNPFEVAITRNAFAEAIAHRREEIREALDETLRKASLAYNQIDRVFLTGGSTLIPSIGAIFHERFGKEKIIHTDVFSSVGYGLVQYAKRVAEGR